MKHEELTHKIIGCAMKVHSTLGNGFQEVIYQRALAIEMTKQGLGYRREMEMTIYYEGEDIENIHPLFLMTEKCGLFGMMNIPNGGLVCWIL
jgi:GxxExxY protein